MKNPHAQALGRMTSEKKAKASRENGKKGGRPNKEQFFTDFIARLEKQQPLPCRCNTCDAQFTIVKDKEGVYTSNHRCI